MNSNLNTADSPRPPARTLFLREPTPYGSVLVGVIRCAGAKPRRVTGLEAEALYLATHVAPPVR